MGKLDPEQLTDLKVRGLIEIVDLGISFFEVVLAVLSTTRAALHEYDRLRSSLRGGGRPIVWSEVLDRIREKDQLLAQKLSEVELRKIELGKLWISTTDGADWCYLSFQRDQIARLLESEFGIKFKVRVQRAESAEL